MNETVQQILQYELETLAFHLDDADLAAQRAQRALDDALANRERLQRRIADIRDALKQA